MNIYKVLMVFSATIHTIYSGEPCKKVCILTNTTCITKGASDVYTKVVHGVKGLIPALDPLHIDEIHGAIENVKYKLTNITVYGLKKCSVTKLKLDPNQNTWKHYVSCPKLISHFHYKAEQNSETPVLKGSGKATVFAYDYDILNYGKYSVFVNKDHRPHFFIQTQHSKTKLKGKLIIQISKSCITDISRVNKTEAYMNKNFKATETFLHRPIVKRSMKILINNIDVYIRVYTMGEVLPDKE